MNEQDVKACQDALEAALEAEGLGVDQAEVWRDEDGDEGWHITIEAGGEEYLRGGGTQREVVLAYWTRDDTWYLSLVLDGDSALGGRSTTMPAAELPGGANEPPSAVAQLVRDRIAED